MREPDAALERITLWRLRAPLKKPYRLAFGDLTDFDCVLARIERADGAVGWGEATLLPGYTAETVGGSWALANQLAAAAVDAPAAALAARLDALGPEAAFTATALRTALEQADGHPVLARAGRAPLLGAIGRASDAPAALAAEVETLLDAGYAVFKLKVGWDVDRDLAAVAAVQAAAAGRARLRIDGNQGFSAAEAVAFVSRLDPTGVELVEQPCAAHDWDAAVAVKRAAAAPVMLDEAIYGLDDIRRAADLGCADVIKLKLMKMGGIDRLIEGLRLVRDLGMRAVLGNGVATDLGCWMEGCVALGETDMAGEMNGFLRPARGLCAPPLRLEGAAMRIDGAPRAPDPGALAALATAEAGYRRAPASAPAATSASAPIPAKPVT